MDNTEVLVKIRRIVRSINLESKKIQKEYGVSIPQVLCLGYLQRAPQFQSTQGEIRKYLNLNASTVSGIIRRLEKKGYLARLPKSGDKRVVNIALTTSGDQLLGKIPALLHEQLTEKLNRLEPDELERVQNGLDTLVKLLDIGSIEASPMITIEDDLEEQEA